jgi:nitrate/nitrite transporter NarK
MGFSYRATGFVAAVPYLVSMVAMIGWGRLSDARNKRILDSALTTLLAAAALAIASVSANAIAVLIALSLAMAGGLASVGPFQGLLSTFARGPAAASGLALVNSIGTLGGFSGPVIVGTLKSWTGGYGAAMAALAAAQLLAALIVLGVGRIFIASPRSRRMPSQ